MIFCKRKIINLGRNHQGKGGNWTKKGMGSSLQAQTPLSPPSKLYQQKTKSGRFQNQKCTIM